MIESKMKIANIIEKYPATIPVFMKYGINCVACPFSSFDDIEMGLTKNGIESQEEISQFYKDIETAISGKE